MRRVGGCDDVDGEACASNASRVFGTSGMILAVYERRRYSVLASRLATVLTPPLVRTLVAVLTVEHRRAIDPVQSDTDPCET